jgi:hypothetical protein
MVLIHGRLDPEGGATLITALNALTPPPAQGETRTTRQRRADALIELARRALTTDRLPTTGGMRPQVGILVTPQHLINQPTTTPQATTPQTTGAQTTGAQTTGAQTTAALAAAPPWLDWIGDVPASIAQRIACDADIWRIILDPATGQPTNVGRTHRLVPTRIRKALHARDRGCRFPGCRAPTPWTDAHHITPWAHGGPTNINNLILLCRFHHTLTHEGRWTIRLDTDTGHVTASRPNGTPYEINDHRRPWPATNGNAA